MQHRIPTSQQIGPIACIINKQIWSKTLHDPNWTSNLFSNTRTLTHKRPLSMFRQPFFPFDANLDFYYVSKEERKKKKKKVNRTRFLFMYTLVLDMKHEWFIEYRKIDIPQV